MSGYLIDNTRRPITFTRPSDSYPSFWVETMQEAFMVIDLDIAMTEEAGYDQSICLASPSTDALNPA